MRSGSRGEIPVEIERARLSFAKWRKNRKKVTASPTASPRIGILQGMAEIRQPHSVRCYVTFCGEWPGEWAGRLQAARSSDRPSWLIIDGPPSIH